MSKFNLTPFNCALINYFNEFVWGKKEEKFVIENFNIATYNSFLWNIQWNIELLWTKIYIEVFVTTVQMYNYWKTMPIIDKTHQLKDVIV